MTVNVPTEKQATRGADRLFAQLVEAVNGLAEVDWPTVLAEDPSPDASLTRLRSMVTVSGMLAHVTALALEPTEAFLGAMTTAALGPEADEVKCPICLAEPGRGHQAWCTRQVDQ